MDDDLELEVSDLRTGRAVPASFGTSRATPAERAEIGQTTADEETSPRVEPLDPARATSQAHPARSRQARGYAVAALVLLVCAGILLSLPGPQASLRRALAGPTPTPTPTATLTPGADAVVFENMASWGTLTLDGSPLSLLQREPGTSLPLPRGRHTVAYEAPPWAPLRCQISVPAQRDDTCPIDTQIHYDNVGGAPRVIDLGATPGKLPEAQRAALTSAVASAFQANHETADLPPGDHYLGADGTPAVATEPMRATLTLTLNTDPARVAPSIPIRCVTMCDWVAGGGGSSWMVISAHTIARWQFATADGTVIQPGASSDLDVIYTLGAQWAGGTWQATLTPYYQGDSGEVCLQAFSNAFPPNGDPLPNTSSGGRGEYPGRSDAEGCVQVVSTGDSGGASSGGFTTPTPLPADAAVFIARCGVVLAGSAAAHAAQPQLPMASAHEWALAKQWLAQQRPG